MNKQNLRNYTKRSVGLGDTIHKFTKATGKDCGCGKRQTTLNRLFPYNN